MEGQVQDSPKLTDNDDVKYVSGLSTILVATIQEAKDRISQIEYIFCSQLFPHFQSKSKILQKIYSEAKKASQAEWKEKENDLLLLIEKHKLEKQKTLEENQSLKLEKAKPTKEQEEKIDKLLSRLKSQQHNIDELRMKLLQKSKESDEMMELQNKLIHLVQSKVSVIVNNEKELKDHEEKTIMLLAKISNLEKKIDGLQEELRERTEEVAKGNEMKANLLKKIDVQASEIMNNEQLLHDQDKEKKIMVAKLEHLEGNSCKLQKELLAKTKEVEEGKTLQKQLSDHIDLNDSEMLKYKEQLEMCEKEKKLLLIKVEGLEEKVNGLQVELRERTDEVIKGKVLYGNLLKHNKSKSSELWTEKKKLTNAIDAYKRLKSEHIYLRRKFGLTSESMLSPNELEDETDSLRKNQNQIISPDLEDINQDISIAASEPNKVQNDNNLVDDKVGKLDQASSSLSPSSTLPVAPKCPSTSKSAPVAGKKRPASCWRDTRSHKGLVGPDPHDDFLDTPYEHVRGNLNKERKEEVCDLPIPVLNETKFDNSDEETQDVNADLKTEKCKMPVQMGEKIGFKYVEPVRKKAERESLKGVECKQCKKFYDAVLCNDEDKNNHNIRCEHHEGVSRHRYRYVPPMTPEGFWNIGFESEM
ncbi:hypothetical protein FEM48_Zijuj01G0022200 [Ziziphus jujuba var. spinosa]|uniref:DNA endonuclease activator Ctp1 C-terminal domain-containing protein n=1 Tax=Ziziphus jujuba var. spinosa TaxID=714518 RepID=A0A978VYJ3_ZIZJJ|nr:protein gamma response 1 isoform X2 [Ziziphus jujuba var. spinosa]XP_048336165.1 protein gamma response 1 isoform X2 [Ziziphus jujuba var. spinosa]KAH7544777.1 hypothetical protein FEM48_Zijuj01G0022200 [Ziziphus jujuba var. spinosa]